MKGLLFSALLIAGLFPVRAGADTGGGELTAPLGWNRAKNEVYFAVYHWDESGCPPTVLCLSLARKEKDFGPLPWSQCTAADSVYQSKLRALKQGLVPLVEQMTPTIASRVGISSADTVAVERYRWPRFVVWVGWFNGACPGTVEAVTYVDPSVRMIRSYVVPNTNISIGLFSFCGRPSDECYEVQLPALLPGQDELVHLEWKPNP